ncbi:cytochrome P450 [Artemisia annua]|uniref:Cytochrome P450 n=1 Tax=Artemisia annua TaxID=35608 RepID=A0A2U1N248_ARTAN|nr:cytochrome P450 [Artemisia annua]
MFLNYFSGVYSPFIAKMGPRGMQSARQKIYKETQGQNPFTDCLAVTIKSVFFEWKILAVGHVAHDLNMWYSKLANEGRTWQGKLPDADYKIVEYVKGEYNDAQFASQRSCFSICICRGGQMRCWEITKSGASVGSEGFSKLDRLLISIKEKQAAKRLAKLVHKLLGLAYITLSGVDSMAESLKIMFSAIGSSCNDMVHKWELLTAKTSSTDIDVWPYIDNLAGDVISRTAFGSNYKEAKKIFRIQKEQIELIFQMLFILHLPGRRFIPTKANKKFEENRVELQTMLRGIIDKKKKAIKMGEASHCDDLLGILLESNSKEIEEDGVGMSMEDVIEEFYIKNGKLKLGMRSYKFLVPGNLILKVLRTLRF